MEPSAGAADLPSTSYTQSNPIDLTLDDDDTESSSKCDRKLKRPCSASRSFNAACESPSTPVPTRFPYHSGLSPAMSSSSLQPDNRPPNPTLYPPQFGQSSMQMNMRGESEAPMPSMPAFAGPSNSSAFFKSPAAPPRAFLPPAQPANGSHMLAPPLQQHQLSPKSAQEASRQVIDLTSSPSPPPSMHRPPPQMSQGSLPADLPPKTPVCIGQIPATALVLYPIGYLLPQPGNNSPEVEWAPVRLSYEHNAQGKPGCTETIHIRTPNMTSPTGEVVPGENFAVVEQKAATILGPMLGKGLIRLDGRVRRGQPNVRILIVYLILYSTKCLVAADYSSHSPSIHTERQHQCCCELSSPEWTVSRSSHCPV